MTVRDLIQELILGFDLDDEVACWDEKEHEYIVMEYAPIRHTAYRESSDNSPDGGTWLEEVTAVCF